eukprot:4096942-Amphidinium_carterae.1
MANNPWGELLGAGALSSTGMCRILVTFMAQFIPSRVLSKHKPQASKVEQDNKYCHKMALTDCF